MEHPNLHIEKPFVHSFQNETRMDDLANKNLIDLPNIDALKPRQMNLHENPSSDFHAFIL
jgi:hypothetical protein